ncbi:hypothetical protein J5893_00530 [bacterium]|nr:hypothetical protein [bacterium]
MVDKIRRDSTYSVAKAMNDIIRYTFVLENHEQVVRFLEYFIERYMSGIKNFFDADPDLTKLDIKDK